MLFNLLVHTMCQLSHHSWKVTDPTPGGHWPIYFVVWNRIRGFDQSRASGPNPGGHWPTTRLCHLASFYHHHHWIQPCHVPSTPSAYQHIILSTKLVLALNCGHHSLGVTLSIIHCLAAKIFHVYQINTYFCTNIMFVCIFLIVYHVCISASPKGNHPSVHKAHRIPF